MTYSSIDFMNDVVATLGINRPDDTDDKVWAEEAGKLAIAEIRRLQAMAASAASTLVGTKTTSTLKVEVYRLESGKTFIRRINPAPMSWVSTRTPEDWITLNSSRF